jgi:hypothetical protein
MAPRPHSPGNLMEKAIMKKLALAAVLAALASTPAAAQANFPNLVGTWKGTSESVVLPAGNEHHREKGKGPLMSSVPFTMVIEKQDGRRLYGTFASAKHKETVIAVIAANGAIYMVDDDGYSVGNMITPTKLELCYMKQSPKGRVASCTEMTKE